MTDHSEGPQRTADAFLTAEGSDGFEALSSLGEWLRREHELRGRVGFANEAISSDRMSGGTLVDVLAVAVGAGGAVSVLANSLSLWLRQPRRANVRIQVSKPDGTKVEISGEHLRTPAQLENILRTSLHPATDDSRPAEEPSTGTGTQ